MATLNQLKLRAMTQAGEDTDDLSDYTSLLGAWINEAYAAFLEKRYGVAGLDKELMSSESDEPELPERVHGALADFATYRLLMMGNQPKQERAQAFYGAYGEALTRMRSEAEEALYAETGRLEMKNLYV